MFVTEWIEWRTSLFIYIEFFKMGLLSTLSFIYIFCISRCSLIPSHLFFISYLNGNVLFLCPINILFIQQYVNKLRSYFCVFANQVVQSCRSLYHLFYHSFSFFIYLPSFLFSRHFRIFSRWCLFIWSGQWEMKVLFYRVYFCYQWWSR